MMQTALRVIKADERHIDGIAKVCTDGYWATYGASHPQAYISRIVKAFYNTERISQEVAVSSCDWGGYFVALENGKVLGAGGGGMIAENTGEIFVLYLDPERRNEGIGTRILEAITARKKDFGAKEQWVSVQKGNHLGIPFYEAKGFTFRYEKQGYGNEAGEDFVSLRYSRTI
jgi:GNAT superfamily N-acetyltransferase